MCDFSLFFVDSLVQCKATLVITMNYTCTIETKNRKDKNTPRKRKKTRKSKKHYELNAHATTSILNINICAKQAKHEKYVMANKLYIFCNANNSGDTTTATGQRGKTKTSAKMFMDTRKERISLNKY